MDALVTRLAATLLSRSLLLTLGRGLGHASAIGGGRNVDAGYIDNHVKIQVAGSGDKPQPSLGFQRSPRYDQTASLEISEQPARLKMRGSGRPSLLVAKERPVPSCPARVLMVAASEGSLCR